MASSQNYAHIKVRVQKPYPIYDQNGRNQLKLIPYLWPTQPKNHTLWGRTYLYSRYKGVPPGRMRDIVPLRGTLGGHSRPQSLRSFWPVAGIKSSGRTRFSEHAQSISFVLSTNQICQIWREVRESRTSGVGQSQSSRFLPQARRIVGSGYENAKARRRFDNITHAQNPRSGKFYFRPSSSCQFVVDA